MSKFFGLFDTKEAETTAVKSIHPFSNDEWPSIDKNKPTHSFSNKTTKELIEEIHNSFNTEADFLLNEAKNFKEVNNLEKIPEIDKAVVDKGEALKALGFTSSPTTRKAQQEKQKQHEVELRNNREKARVERENAKKKEMIETINYFSTKYPLYKFITEESVKKICSKYGLIYGSVEYFTGDVPDKNLKEIQNFKVDEQDAAIRVDFVAHYMRYDYASRISKKLSLFCSRGNLNPINCGIHDTIDNKSHVMASSNTPDEAHYENVEKPTYNKAPFEIAAPKKDFDMKGLETNGFEIVSSPQEIEIPDPVVLQPVWHNDKKHYLVVTAWGDEAEDELVINENFN